MWVECLAPVDLWEVDLNNELYSGFKSVTEVEELILKKLASSSDHCREISNGVGLSAVVCRESTSCQIKSHAGRLRNI